MTYFPEPSWIEKYLNGENAEFKGIINISRISFPNEKLPNGRISVAPVCVDVQVVHRETNPCCNGINSYHSDCPCPSVGGAVFKETYYTTTQSKCFEIDPFWGYIIGTGGGGGGGGTMPSPGGGYEPCTGGGGPGSVERVSTLPPCPPTPGDGPTPIPGYTYNPSPNASWANLQAKMTVQGVQFNPLEVSYLNQLPSSVTDRIDKLWDAFGSRIRNGLDALIAQELGKVLTSSELLILNNIGDNQFLYANMAKIIYLANGFSANVATQLAYNSLCKRCSECRGNAYKHALFLIINAQTWGIGTASALADAHEQGENLNSNSFIMDYRNNREAETLYLSKNSNDWPSDVRNAIDSNTSNFVYVLNEQLVFTSTPDPQCP